MKKIVIYIFIMTMSAVSYAQSEEGAPAQVDNEVMPEFPKFEGGENALLTYIQDNLKYPEIAKENGTEGTVTIRFEVNTSGEVSEAQLIGENLGNGTGQEAIRVINSTSGKWTPGKIEGTPITMKLQLPVKFSLK